MDISFDWDFTLSEERLQKVAQKFADDGHTLWIITTRPKHPNPQVQWDNKTLFRVADELGIPNERIIFTGYNDKFPVLTEHKIDIHFDDDIIEIELMEENDCPTQGVLINS